jgi:bifunctional enzyme CysN/CysC
VVYAVDIDTLSRQATDRLGLNAIGRVVFSLAQPIFFDTYDKNRATGSFILIDTVSNATVAAGMIIDRRPVEEMPAGAHTPAARGVFTLRPSAIGGAERERRLQQKGATIWLTGLVGAGKTGLAYALEHELFKRGALPLVLDGENIRLGISRDLDFSQADRAEHHRRVAEIARMLSDAGLIAICAFASPIARWRAAAAERIGSERFVEIHVSSPLDYCKKRQSGGLYEKAERGELKHFPGVHFPYEAPEHPALTLPLHEISQREAVEQILAHLAARGIFPLGKQR